MNVLAAIRLVVTASHEQNKEELVNDAMLLFGLYMSYKTGSFDFQKFAHSDRLKPAIQAAANVLDAISDMADDPAQLENLTDLIASL